MTQADTPIPDALAAARTGHRTIRRRLLISFVVMVLVPALTITAATLGLIYTSQRHHTFAQLTSVAALKEAEINTWTQSRQIDLALLASDPQLLTAMHRTLDPSIEAVADADLLQRRFAHFITATGAFDRLSLLDNRGYVVVSTDPSIVGAFQGLQPHFKQGLQSPCTFVQTLVYSSPTDAVNHVVSVHPINGPSGPVGLLAGRISLDQLNAIMTERAGLGDTGETYLVGSNQVLLTNSRFRSHSRGSAFVHSRGIEAALRQRRGGQDSYLNYRHHPVLGVYRYLPDLQIALLAEQEQAEAMRPMYDAMRRSALAALVATLLAMVASVWVARSLTRPIVTLSRTARRIADGNLDLTAPLFRDDEIGQLAVSFNHMTGRLRELLAREQNARAEAEAANRAKDEFLAVLSHELRTPLTAILGWVQMLRKNIVDPLEVPNALAVIERNAWEQSQLVKDLLDVSAIIRGKLTLASEPVDLGRLTPQVLDSMRLAAQAKRLDVRLETPRESVVVQGDPSRLRQVLWNLLSNAIKFTPENGRIALRLLREDEQAVLRIEDSGIGIAPDFLPYVFERFRQADSSRTRRFGGLGLGLAIVRHLVELHGGSVAVASAGENKGTIFTVRLPLSPLAVPPPASAPNTPAPSLDGARILLVEDEPDTRRLVVEFLHRHGGEIEAVSRAEEGLARLQEHRFDLLISDIAMPGNDGFWLIEQVRRLPSERGGGVPAIALTALADDGARRTSLQLGFNAHMIKPINPDDLLRRAAELIGGARH